MASIITATVASGLTQQADNSGVLQLASGTGNLVTVPSVTGTAMVSGNMPAFSATNNAVQSISGSTYTKVLFQTEVFDTNNNFASSRFTPTVAGYYQINATLYHNWGTAGSVASTIIYKNGVIDTAFASRYGSNTGPWGSITTSTLLYLNGSTDYVEVYAWSNNGSPSIETSNAANTTTFSGCLVRSA
jgi:hypothetical protein